MADMRIDQLIAEADRARLGRAARRPRRFRLAALQLAARGLRVEREVEFKTSVPEQA